MSNIREIQRIAKIRAKAYWKKVDALAEAEGLTLSEAREKVDADAKAARGEAQ